MKPAIPSTDRQTLMAAVVFADLVGFTKKSIPAQLAAKDALTALLQRLVSPYPKESRVVLDTGDGAAVGFLFSPEYALGLALRLRSEIDAGSPDARLRSSDLRLGINLGPVKVVTGVDGRPNLVGEGINSAERIMSFAGPGDTTASRSFQEAVYYLDAAFQGLFEPLGTRADKHGREHEVFRLTASPAAIEAALDSLGTAHGPVAPRSAAARMASAAASLRRGPQRVSGLVTPLRMGAAAGALVVIAAVSWQVWAPRQPARNAPAAAGVAPGPAADSSLPRPEPMPAAPAATPVATAPPPSATAPVAAVPPQPAEPSRAVPATEPAAASPAPASTPPTERRPTPDPLAAKRARPAAAAPRSAMGDKPAAPAPAAGETAASAEAPQRTSQRCSRLLQRAALGEVLTAAEQRELSEACR
jgi:class 3 adenylate cyclase